MLAVRKIDETMIEPIVAMCQQFNNPNIQKSGWKDLLQYSWRQVEDPAGYALTDNGKVVGFLGTLFSHPIVNGIPRTLCNISSFIVDPKYRIHGGLLLREVLHREDITVTNLSSAQGLLNGMRALGFETLDDTSILVSPLSSFPEVWNPFLLCLKRDKEAMVEHLRDEEKKILYDHLSYPCRHLLVSKGKQYCYLLYNVKEGNRYRYAYVHYISHPDFYARYAGAIVVRLYLEEKIARMTCDQRLLSGYKIRFGKKVNLTVPRLYRPAEIPREQVPNVYSELVILSL